MDSKKKARKVNESKSRKKQNWDTSYIFSPWHVDSSLVLHTLDASNYPRAFQLDPKTGILANRLGTRRLPQPSIILPSLKCAFDINQYAISHPNADPTFTSIVIDKGLSLAKKKSKSK